MQSCLREIPELGGIVVRAEAGVIATVGVSSNRPQPNIVAGISQQIPYRNKSVKSELGDLIVRIVPRALSVGPMIQSADDERSPCCKKTAGLLAAGPDCRP